MAIRLPGQVKPAASPVLLDQSTASASVLTEALIRADRLGDEAKVQQLTLRILCDTDLASQVLRMLARGTNLLGWELD